MRTYQDYEAAGDKLGFIKDLIGEYCAGSLYQTALTADEYDAQRNVTILNYQKMVYDVTGIKLVNFVASNNKIVSNFFARLNTQRCTYSLGNGVSFGNDTIKPKLGADFDTVLKNAGYYALIHGVSFLLWNNDRAMLFKATEFAPLWDEETGALRAGVRFWRLSPEKPMYATLYTKSGYTRLRAGDDGSLSVIKEQQLYKTHTATTEIDGEEVTGKENYSSLPIVPLWGSRLKQSTLVGMRSAIDSYDLIRSGYANDLQDCAEIYWLIENYGGMKDEDLQRLRDRLLLTHMVSVDTSDGGKITPHTQEIPHQARGDYLDRIRAGIYEDYGGLDVHTIAAGATNDHIDAAYQPMDENADDYEYQILDCMKRLLPLLGVDTNKEKSVPLFTRNRISNFKEQVEIVMLEAPHLDEVTILEKCPNITPDEVKNIIERKAAQELKRLGGGAPNDDNDDDGGEPPQGGDE